MVLVNAFLTEDYALDASKDADDALKVAEGQPEFSTPERSSLLATARSLLALAAGDRAAARKHADVAVGAVSPDPPAFALLASARVRALAGDSAGSARELDRALGLALDSAPVVVNWASSRLDGGDPVGARRALANLLEKHKSNSRARLLLAVSERALGETNWTQNLELACRSDAKISQTIRTACAVEFALQALLDGDRSGAARKAKAAVQTSEDPFVLGQGSLLLASLGEVDVAEEVLVHARRLAEPSAIPLLWADLAIQLGRGQPGEVGGFWEHPAGPERDLLALRLAYARSGVPGIVGILKGLPPGIQDIDWDIRAFAALASAGGPTKSELTLLEKRGEKGDPIVSYVLGILALEGKDFKLAVHRLEKAIGMQGDACQAAMLYQMASKHVRRGAQINKAALRAMRARNVKCGLPET
jgi:hypothetical protein